MHGFLLLIILFGAAFFTAKKPSIDSLPPLRVVPDIFADGPSGGGGNPNVRVMNEQKRGDPNAKVSPPIERKPTPPPQPVKKIEPKVVEPIKPKETVDLKAVPRLANNDKAKTDVVDLKPVKRVDPVKAKANAEAARAARENGAKLANQLSKTSDALQRGFSQGTAVDVWGPGGLAYADYAQFVKQIYDDAWVVMPDLAAEDGAVVVKVTIARDGTVVRAIMATKSGQRSLDLSVQRALDSVTKIRPFPESTKDDQQTFKIEFNLKAKRGLG